ncbi:MAG TPA: NAD(P)/FAD-dependent oxidoreductase, partial [bacterium]|nr:NAD(P)/FAD-dependent oxidoreductase [bacterium]
PVILDVSRRFTEPDAAGTGLRVTWGPGPPDWDTALRAGGRGRVSAALREHLPRRLADRLLEVAGVAADVPLAQLRRDARTALRTALEDCPLAVDASEGYRTAEVTAGGVPLEEVSPATLESRVTPGLHLAGEILDATGRLGGFNFLWAWASGRAAGLGAARALGR